MIIEEDSIQQLLSHEEAASIEVIRHASLAIRQDQDHQFLVIFAVMSLGCHAAETFSRPLWIPFINQSPFTYMILSST